MKEWENTVVTLSSDPAVQVKELNALGKKGWELVNITRIPLGHSTTLPPGSLTHMAVVKAYMKREKEKT